MKTLNFNFQALAFMRNHVTMRKRLLRLKQGSQRPEIPTNLETIESWLNHNPQMKETTAAFMIRNEEIIRSVIVFRGKQTDKLFQELLNDAKEILRKNENK